MRALAADLVDLGLEVFYDEYVMKLGMSLRPTIDHGLANSRFSVVVLSHAFFAKEWPQKDLDGLVTRESTGEQAILPIWHNISKDEVIGYSEHADLQHLPEVRHHDSSAAAHTAHAAPDGHRDPSLAGGRAGRPSARRRGCRSRLEAAQSTSDWHHYR